MPPRLAGVEIGVILGLEIKHQTRLLDALCFQWSSPYVNGEALTEPWLGERTFPRISRFPRDKGWGLPSKKKAEGICLERVP